MKFIDKFALVPIERYNLLIKDNNTLLGGGGSVGKEKGSVEEKPLEKNSDKEEQLTPSEKLPRERFQPGVDVTNYEENHLPQNVNNVDDKKHTADVNSSTDNLKDKKRVKRQRKPSSSTDNLKDKKRIKRQRKPSKIAQLPLPPPGIPNRPIKNKFIWLKLF